MLDEVLEQLELLRRQIDLHSAPLHFSLSHVNGDLAELIALERDTGGR